MDALHELAELRVSRRLLLVAAAAGGSALALRPVAAAADSEDTSHLKPGDVARGESADADAVQVRLAEGVVTAEPTGFPIGWNLVAGDEVVVDAESGSFIPIVTMKTDGDRTVFFTRNASGTTREVASYR